MFIRILSLALNKAEQILFLVHQSVLERRSVKMKEHSVLKSTHELSGSYSYMRRILMKIDQGNSVRITDNACRE